MTGRRPPDFARQSCAEVAAATTTARTSGSSDLAEGPVGSTAPSSWRLHGGFGGAQATAPSHGAGYRTKSCSASRLSASASPARATRCAQPRQGFGCWRPLGCGHSPHCVTPPPTPRPLGARRARPQERRAIQRVADSLTGSRTPPASLSARDPCPAGPCSGQDLRAWSMTCAGDAKPQRAIVILAGSWLHGTAMQRTVLAKNIEHTLRVLGQGFKRFMQSLASLARTSSCTVGELKLRRGGSLPRRRRVEVGQNSLDGYRRLAAQRLRAPNSPFPRLRPQPSSGTMHALPGAARSLLCGI
jgi:hypothetical protein